jgi:hypothetical protein
MGRAKHYRMGRERITTGDLPPETGTYTPPLRYRILRPVPAIARVISGGQTGVDRAALDWAIRNDVPHGGWCPKGRRAEDGTIPEKYALEETASRGYADRTRRNVFSADATLILNIGPLEGGTRLTAEVCEQWQKPFLIIQLDATVARSLAQESGFRRSGPIR